MYLLKCCALLGASQCETDQNAGRSLRVECGWDEHRVSLLSQHIQQKCVYFFPLVEFGLEVVYLIIC